MDKDNSIFNTFREFNALKNKCKNKSELSYNYVFYVLHNRFPAGEADIAQDPYYAYCYAVDIIKGRFPAGEAAIATTHSYAYWYARDIIKDRFPAGEAAIAQNSEWAYYYARDVLKKRFPAGERTIYNSDYKNNYEKKILKKLGLTWRDLGYG